MRLNKLLSITIINEQTIRLFPERMSDQARYNELRQRYVIVLY